MFPTYKCLDEGWHGHNKDLSSWARELTLLVPNVEKEFSKDKVSFGKVMDLDFTIEMSGSDLLESYDPNLC